MSILVPGAPFERLYRLRFRIFVGFRCPRDDLVSENGRAGVMNSITWLAVATGLCSPFCSSLEARAEEK